MQLAEGEAVAGRECGSCSLCCKLLKIEELHKPVGQWCPNCAPGKGGCKIYGSHPPSCQDFMCVWRTSPDFGDEWYPAKCKMVLYVEGDGNRIALHVDPANPTAWRQEPFYSQIKEMAQAAAVDQQQFIVYVKNRVTAVLPNKEVELGEMHPGDHIIVAEQHVPVGRDWRAFLLPAKDVPSDQVGRWIKR